MNYFRYKIIESTGELSSGFIKLPYRDVTSVISHLEREGAIIVYVKKVGRLLSTFLKFSTFQFQRRMNRTIQAELLGNLSVMLRAGITLTAALEEAAEGAEIRSLKADIKDMIAAIQSGAAFSEAAGKYTYIFPETVIFLIRIGEETGQLDTMLRDASEHLRRIQNIVDETKQALMYPVFVFLALGGGLIFWLYYVLPKIMSLFTEMDMDLPALTLFVMKISELVQNYFFYILFGVALVVLALGILRKGSKMVRKAMDAILLDLPVVGTIISQSTLSFISEYFALLINAGIELMQSVSILKDSIRNLIFKEKLEEVRVGLTRGEGIGDSFKKALIFPSFVTRMIAIGEASGSLPDQLVYIAEEYQKKLSLLVATIGKLIEPIVLIVAGAMFAIIIGALLLPIYDLVSRVGG